MAKYNIYRVKGGKASALREKLASAAYEETSRTELGTYELVAYFTPEPKLSDIWWLTQYGAFFDNYKLKKNKVYSAAIVAENKKTKEVFLIALGRTHFYVQEFIDYTFGLKMAERIGNEQSAKFKSSKQFGGQTSKSMISFSGDTSLSFSPGEATDYVKLKPTDTGTWGKSYVHFGTSLQFGSIGYPPGQLDILLSNLEASYGTKAKFNLPRMVPVKDEDQVAKLDGDLVRAINDESAQLSVVDFELYGVDFVFSQQTHIKLEFEGRISEEIKELDVAAVKKFVEDHKIDPDRSLRGIKAKLFVNESSKFTVDLIRLLDYVGDGNAFLYQGSWFIFSDSFLENLMQSIASVTLEPLGLEFSYLEHEAWKLDHEKRQKGVKKKDKLIYPERYAIDKIIAHGSGLKNIDRVLDYRRYNKSKLSIELADIYDPLNEEMNVVKIGDAKSFGYAFDQAALTLNLTKANQYTTQDGEVLTVKRLRLSLLSQSANTPTDAASIESLSFRIKLGALVNLAKEKNVQLVVSFAKYTKKPREKSPSVPGVVLGSHKVAAPITS